MPEEVKQEQKGEEKPKNLAEFAAKFSAKGRAPVELGGDPTNKPNLEAAAQIKVDSERQAEQREEDKKESQKKFEESGGERKKPFIRQQIDAKHEAEKERDALKVKEVELQTKLDQNESKVKELQAKIDSGSFSTEKESQFQKQIADLESKAKEEKDSLVNENQKLKSRLSYHDLAEDEDFQNQYLQPVVVAHREAMGIIGQDKSKGDAFTRALIANSAALRADKSELRQNAEKERDDILAGIVDGMNQFSANRFTTAVNDYIRASQKHAEKLLNHEETSKEMKSKFMERRNTEYAARLQTWDRTFKTTADNYKTDATLTDEEKKIAKELKLDVDGDLERAHALAGKTITGATSMPDAIDLVHKGRVYPALKAKLAIRDKQLAEAQALITKLRGGGTSGGDAGSAGTEKKAEKETREEWQRRRFSPNRPELQKN